MTNFWLMHNGFGQGQIDHDVFGVVNRWRGKDFYLLLRSYEDNGSLICRVHKIGTLDCNLVILEKRTPNTSHTHTPREGNDEPMANTTGHKSPDTSLGHRAQVSGHLVRPNRTKSLFEARRLSAGSTVMVGAAPRDVFRECGQAGKGMTPTALLVHTTTSYGPTVAVLPVCTATVKRGA